MRAALVTLMLAVMLKLRMLLNVVVAALTMMMFYGNVYVNDYVNADARDHNLTSGVPRTQVCPIPGTGPVT